MKKRILALVLALTMALSTSTCFAGSNSTKNTADALNELGLFLGVSSGNYALEKDLTRAQGITLLVRMIGMEETAEAGSYQTPFTDVPDWAEGYIGYAYANGITNGTGAATFSPDKTMTDYMFLTLVLRALGYSDKGEEPLFVWNAPYALAQEVGLIQADQPDNSFTRGDAVEVFWAAMQADLVDKDMTLAESLIEQGVFTAREYKKAVDIQKNGRVDKDEENNPSQPDPEPQPDPTPTPDPEPQPDPTPTPDPEPQPDPTPTPDPEPQPDPTPTPDPEPQPDPTPTPDPEPQPDPTPTPDPDVPEDEEEDDIGAGNNETPWG